MDLQDPLHWVFAGMVGSERKKAPIGGEYDDFY